MKLTLFDRIKLFGLPFHGLWKGGAVTLPNGSTKTMSAPRNPTVIVVKIPDQPLVSRTTGEAAADATAGKQWLNYALISGNRYGPFALPIPPEPSGGYAIVIYIDAAKKAWLMKIRKAASNTLAISVKRFLNIANRVAEDWSPEAMVACPAEYYSSTVSCYTACQNSSGREFALTSTYGDMAYRNLVKVTCTGTVNKAAGDLGLTFGFAMLEYPNRTFDVRNVVRQIIGSVRAEHRQQYKSYASPTTYDYALTIWEDGVRTYQYIPDGTLYQVDATSPEEVTTSGSLTKTVTDTQGFERILHAAYLDDQLTLFVLRKSLSTVLTYGDVIYTGSGHWQFTSVTRDTDNAIEFKYGAAVVDGTHDSFSGPDGSITPSFEAPFDSSGFTSSDLLTGDYLVRTCVVGSEFRYYSTLDASAPSLWSNPCIAMCNYSGSSSAYTIVPVSVHAPDGSSQATTISIAQLFATWHPVTKQLSVDSQLVCWF